MGTLHTNRAPNWRGICYAPVSRGDQKVRLRKSQQENSPKVQDRKSSSSLTPQVTPTVPHCSLGPAQGTGREILQLSRSTPAAGGSPGASPADPAPHWASSASCCWNSTCPGSDPWGDPGMSRLLQAGRGGSLAAPWAALEQRIKKRGENKKSKAATDFYYLHQHLTR